VIPSSQGCYKSLLTLSAIFPCLAHSQPLAQISIATGILQQDYREFSASAPNGIFNQETGNLNTWQIQANYLPTLSISKLNLPLYLQGQYRHSNGNTQYDGYLQQGQMLIPFESTTKNNLQDIQASIGLRLTPQPVQVVPFVAYVDHTWKRGLSQYQETFSHKSLALGVSTTWQINAKWEALGLFSVGQMQSAQINVPQVSFLASLGTQIIKTAQAQLAYGFNQHWQLALSANYQHYGYGQSTLSNGFIEPESMTKQRSVLTSLHYIY